MEAVIHHIQSRWPQSAIFAFSMNPEDTQARHGVGAYAIRRNTWTVGAVSSNGMPDSRRRLKAAARLHPLLFKILRTVYALVFKVPAGFYREVGFLAKSWRILRSFDMLVVAGGGQLTEACGGPGTFPYTIFKWICLARIAGVKPIFLNVGAGPLARRLSKYFVRTALFLADYVSFRDRESAELVNHIGFRGATPVFPDSVYSIKINGRSEAPLPEEHLPTLGIAPMAYGLEPLYVDGNPHAYDSLIRGLAACGSRMIEDQKRITLFCTDIGVDAPSVYDLHRVMNKGSELHVEQQINVSIPKTTADLLRAISAMDYIVTCRFHGVIFAHLLNKPVVALSHHPKMSTLMNDLGLSRYCLDIKKVDPDSLTQIIFEMMSNAAQIKSRMNAIYLSYKEALVRQFDKLFPKSVGV
jgi:polysaccharide pyruvyl transferase WcaK-like protein